MLISFFKVEVDYPRVDRDAPYFRKEAERYGVNFNLWNEYSEDYDSDPGDTPMGMFITNWIFHMKIETNVAYEIGQRIVVKYGGEYFERRLY